MNRIKKMYFLCKKNIKANYTKEMGRSCESIDFRGPTKVRIDAHVSNFGVLPFTAKTPLWWICCSTMEWNTGSGYRGKLQKSKLIWKPEFSRSNYVGIYVVDVDVRWKSSQRTKFVVKVRRHSDFFLDSLTISAKFISLFAMSSKFPRVSVWKLNFLPIDFVAISLWIYIAASDPGTNCFYAPQKTFPSNFNTLFRVCFVT